jgi:hypothetical protein
LSEAAKKREWSPATVWIMGIFAALGVPFIIWLAGYVFDPAPSDAERNAVFSLVSDLRSTPLAFRAVYLNEHDFMKPEWLKENPKDAYWESLTFPENLLRFAQFTGRMGLAGPVLEARTGQVVVRPKSLEKLDYGNGKVEYRVTTERVNPPDDQNAHIDTKAMRLYALQPSLLPKKISTHLNDLSLPAKVRDALYGFVRETDATSFATVESAKVDFLLVMPDPPADVDFRLQDGTPLYPFRGIDSEYDFLERAVGIIDALEAWGHRYSVALDLFRVPGPPNEAPRND